MHSFPIIAFLSGPLALIPSSCDFIAPPREPMPEYLTTREIAQLLRVKERQVYDLAAKGQLPVRRVTGKLLFPKADMLGIV